MDNFVTILVSSAAEILATLVVCAIGFFGSWLLSRMSKNKHLENIAAATAQVLSAAQSTVLELQQTFVLDWKAAQHGKLTQDQIEELQQKLIEITMAKLSEPTLKLLNAAKVDVLTMITSAAEEHIYNMKASA